MLQCEFYSNIACACTNTSPARTFVVNSHKRKRHCTRSVYLWGRGFILVDARPLENNRNSSAENPVLILEMPFRAIMIGVLCAIIAPRSASQSFFFFFFFFFCNRIAYSHQFVTQVLTQYVNHLSD
jgi:hypothetical protein